MFIALLIQGQALSHEHSGMSPESQVTQALHGPELCLPPTVGHPASCGPAPQDNNLCSGHGSLEAAQLICPGPLHGLDPLTECLHPSSDSVKCLLQVETVALGPRALITGMTRAGTTPAGPRLTLWKDEYASPPETI